MALRRTAFFVKADLHIDLGFRWIYGWASVRGTQLRSETRARSAELLACYVVKSQFESTRSLLLFSVDLIGFRKPLARTPASGSLLVREVCNNTTLHYKDKRLTAVMSFNGSPSAR
jgi:hypothetical protein